jgi:hypothetical protein
LFRRSRLFMRLRSGSGGVRPIRARMRFLHFCQSRAKQLTIHDDNSLNYELLLPPEASHSYDALRMNQGTLPLPGNRFFHARRGAGQGNCHSVQSQ